MLTYKIEPIVSNRVLKIGDKYIHPKGIVTVIWYWTNNGRQLNKIN